MLKNCKAENIFEIRLRTGYPVTVKGMDGYFFLGRNGTTIFRENAEICDFPMIEEIIGNVTERSLYAFNDEIKKGYLTTSEGVRIGLAGECVYDSGQIVTIKNFTSLNIRIPHEIPNCSEEIYDRLFQNDIYNSLIIAPPAMGKTTILKDLICKINDNYSKNILVIDERDEFGRISGKNIDFIRRSDKLFAFEYGIRSMSPDIVITDELCGEKDWQCVKSASDSGVRIIASIHGSGLEDVLKKKFFIDNVFDRYIVLDNKGVPGVLKKMYDGELKEL